MSFFDSIGDMFSGDSFLTIGLTAMAAAGIYSAETSADANIEAAKIAAQSEADAAAAVRAGNEAAQKRYDALRDESAPGQSYLRQVTVQDPTVLTPFQQQQLEEARRQTDNSLAASGLAGSGRTFVAAKRGVESDLRNRFIDDNTARADSAAKQLSGQYAGAIGSSATVDQATGRAVGATLEKTGDINANVGVANAQTRGTALGDVASFIATEAKDKARDSRYEKMLKRSTGGDDEERV